MTDFKWSTDGTAYTYDFDRFELEYALGQETTFKFVPPNPGNSIWVAGADQIVGNDDDAKDVNNNGIFDVDPFTGTPIDDWPKNKNGTASGETVWWENDSTYDNKNHYITQLGLGASDGDESTPWNSGDDRTNHLFSGTVGEIQTNPANALTTKLTLRVEADTIFQINATYTPLDEPTNDKTIEGVNGNDINLESVGIGITMIESSIDSLDNARSAIGFLDNEIDNLSQQMATIGSNLAELEVASERMRNHVFLSQMGIDRLSDDTLVQESTNYAKEQIRTQASSALVTQAFSISEKVLNFIL